MDVYNDDRKFTPEQLVTLAGMELDEAKRILEFTQSKSNSHSAWLTFMYPRLYIARELLREDGVIFISIDDNEQAQLKMLCDEVFGEENFVAQFPWRKRTAKSDVSFGVSQDFEWIISYGRPDFLAGIAHERKYHSTPDFPNDKWRLSDLTTQRSAEERPNSAFNMVDPKTNKIYQFNPKRTWGVSKDTFDSYYQQGKIVFPDDYDFLNITIPAYRVFESEDHAKALKKYGVEASIKAASTQLPKEVGLSENGNKDIVELFGGKLFSFPKPVSLVKYFIDLINNKDEGSLILDFFAGSGTTAHAVMVLNAEDGGNRRFITVQIDEPTDPKSEARKSGYETIFDITKARIEKGAAKIKLDNPDYQSDLGFKIFETIPLFDGYLDEMENLDDGLELYDGSKLNEEELDYLLTTWKTYDGIVLTEDLHPIKFANYQAYTYEKNVYFMDKNFNSEALSAFIKALDEDPIFQPSKLVLFGYNFQSKFLRETAEGLKSYKNKKSIELDVVVRY